MALAVLEETAEYLGAGLSDLINLFQPERILIGGWAGLQLGSRFLPAVRRHATSYALRYPAERVSIDLGKLGPDAVTVGAAILPLADFFARGGRRAGTGRRGPAPRPGARHWRTAHRTDPGGRFHRPLAEVLGAGPESAGGVRRSSSDDGSVRQGRPGRSGITPTRRGARRDDDRPKGPGEDAGPLPRDMPDQQAQEGEDRWDVTPADLARREGSDDGRAGAGHRRPRHGRGGNDDGATSTPAARCTRSTRARRVVGLTSV